MLASWEVDATISAACVEDEYRAEEVDLGGCPQTEIQLSSTQSLSYCLWNNGQDLYEQKAHVTKDFSS